ncbi:major facilitator superfamily domain-containing protein [Lanmaoa asiatica]|nr:major facilitator superfamily domain-containing protein [Lanmaoa asiatica]
MASISPRASGFWTSLTTHRSSYPTMHDIDDAEVADEFVEDSEYDGRTPLDKTIDRIGMGWMADNMWIQAVAIILPRVQQHYSVPDNYIGTLSSFMFAGMMVGAVGWGSCSDLVGRSAAFNATLFFTALFGILSSFASSFWSLCVLLFFLGSAVGGSMPTDGTLLLEHMPKGKQYLVTALSVFFSLGSVLSALVALFILPGHSCSPNQHCSPSGNNGWKYVLVCLGLITLSMFLARILFFRLHESPRYLVHAGRHQEALESLQLISRFNGSDITIDLEDVDDRRPPEPRPPSNGSDERAPFLPSTQEARPNRETLLDAGTHENTARNDGSSDPPRDDGVKHYQSTGDSPNSLDSRPFVTPAEEYPPRRHSVVSIGDIPSSSRRDALHDETKRHSRRPHAPRHSSRLRESRASSVASLELKMPFGGVLPRWIKRPLIAWLDRVGTVLSPEWFRTTLLVWGVWFFMSLAYTMFNVYYPKLLETGPRGDFTPKSLEDNLWDVVIFTLGGCPGALLGAYMVESALGRRRSLAGMTLLTAFFCMVFVLVENPFLVRVSSVGISLSATTMYAVLYGVVGGRLRSLVPKYAGQLVGSHRPYLECTSLPLDPEPILTMIVSLHRGGMIAPLLGGTLLFINRSFPVYASVVVYLVTALCIVLLRETAGQGGGGNGERALMH